MADYDVIAVGLCTVDVLVPMPVRFERGEKFPVREVAVAGGGPAATAAAVTGTLGYRTALVGRVGSDEMSTLLREQLRRAGISSQLLIDDPACRTPIGVIEADTRTADRTIFYSVEGYVPARPADLPTGAVENARLLLADGYTPKVTEHALRIAQRAGVPSVIDIETGDPATLRRMLGLASHAILPMAAARALSGKQSPAAALRGLASLTSAQLVVTDGCQGAWALTPSGILHQPAFPVRAVDTTGCGDSFHGAYAVGVLENWPLALCLEFAAWVAGRVASTLGGRAGLPSKKDLRRTNLTALTSALRRELKSLAKR